MYFVLFSISILTGLIVQSIPLELTPVDAGVEDTTPLSESLRLVPHDMRENQSFEQLFRVKGSPDVYVRRAGSLHAVFRDPLYVETFGTTVPLIPTGTIYCIGEVTQSVLDQLGVIARGEHKREIENSPEQVVENWNPIAPNISHTKSRSIRFLDDEGYRRRRLASFVLQISIQ
jgi:hypothetical protein